MQTLNRLKCFFLSIISSYNGEVIKSQNATQFCNQLWVREGRCCSTGPRTQAQFVAVGLGVLGCESERYISRCSESRRT